MKRSKTHMFKIMTLIFKIWIKYPELRLCQLIGNVFECGDNYFREDDELEKKLQQRYRTKGIK